MRTEHFTAPDPGPLRLLAQSVHIQELLNHVSGARIQNLSLLESKLKRHMEKISCKRCIAYVGNYE